MCVFYNVYISSPYPKIIRDKITVNNVSAKLGFCIILKQHYSDRLNGRRYAQYMGRSSKDIYPNHPTPPLQHYLDRMGIFACPLFNVLTWQRASLKSQSATSSCSAQITKRGQTTCTGSDYDIGA